MSTPDNTEAAFIGKVTASATHELRNVLAIIKESAGLIEDIVVSSDEQLESPNSDRLMRAVGRIRDQVARGADLLTSLNQFAHSPDHAEDHIELNQAIQQVSFLCQRKARQGRQFVQGQPADSSLTVVLNSLGLQMALCAAVECCLEQLPEGATVTVRPFRHKDTPSLGFTAEVEGEPVKLVPTEASGWARLAEVLDSLGASVDEEDAAPGFRIVLSG